MLSKLASKALSLPLAVVGLNAIAAPTAPSVPAPGSEALQSLVTTLDERLVTAGLVALTKWDSATPVQDNSRESAVIAHAQQQAAGYALDKDEIAQLLAAQIEANKLVQYGLLAAWHAAGEAPDTPRPNLNTQIRPRLDHLQDRLLHQYARFRPFRTDPACSTWLNQALGHLASDPLHELALIRATGELCANSRSRLSAWR